MAKVDIEPWDTTLADELTTEDITQTKKMISTCL